MQAVFQSRLIREGPLSCGAVGEGCWPHTDITLWHYGAKVLKLDPDSLNPWLTGHSQEPGLASLSLPALWDLVCQNELPQISLLISFCPFFYSFDHLTNIYWKPGLHQALRIQTQKLAKQWPAFQGFSVLQRKVMLRDSYYKLLSIYSAPGR